MAVLVLADQTGPEVSQPTRSAVAAAGQIDKEVHALALGAEGAEAVAKLPGVSKVLRVTGTAYDHGLAEPVAALLVSLAPNYTHLVAPGSATGKNVMPRVAALLEEVRGDDAPDAAAADDEDAGSPGGRGDAGHDGPSYNGSRRAATGAPCASQRPVQR